MVDKHDAAVIDNHLTCKKDGSLKGLVSRMGEPKRIGSAASELDPCTVIRNSDRCGICRNDTCKPKSQPDQRK